jgi:hypothetical protein
MIIPHRALGVSLLLSLAVFLYLLHGEIGFGYYQSGENVQVSASSHPIVLVWVVLVVCLYVALLKQRARTDLTGNARIARRFAAYLIDFITVVVATGSTAAIIPLLSEARRVGHFAWSFQRDYTVPTDRNISHMALLGIGMLLLYAIYPLTKGRQTIGEYVVRIKVFPPAGVEARFTWIDALVRVLFSGAGIAFWPYTLWTGTDRNGRTWYDRVTNCTVSLVEYKPEDAKVAS